MHRFDRMHLSPEVALRTAETLDLEEKSKLAEGIAVLAVIDHRRDYLAAGYSCTLDFCVHRLHMSQDRALKRIQVARAARRFPQVFEHLADGRLSVSTAAVLAPHLTAATVADLLAAAAFNSRQEVLRLIAERSSAVTLSAMEPESAPSVQDTSGSYAPGHTDSLADLLEPPAGEPGAGAVAPGQVLPTRRGRILVTSTGAHEVRLTLTDDEHDTLRQALDLLSHAVPSGDPAIVYARAMQHYVEHLEKRRLGVKRDSAKTQGAPGADSYAPGHTNQPTRPHEPSGTDAPRTGRGIPKRLRRLVWERDGGRCAFVSSDGHRCASTRGLQFDHIVPLSKGGQTTLANLRLLCRPHNQFEAERVLGKEQVQTRRELAPRERVRAKAAAKATAARAKAAAQAEAACTKPATDTESGRVKPGAEADSACAGDQDATMRARRDDIFAALRSLSFKVAEARFGAVLADAMPEATLEACLRRALTELTRPLVQRAERLARCSA